MIAALPAVLYEVLPAVNWATVGSSPGLTVAMSVAGILVIGIPIIGLIHMLMRHFGGWQTHVHCNQNYIYRIVAHRFGSGCFLCTE